VIVPSLGCFGPSRLFPLYFYGVSMLHGGFFSVICYMAELLNSGVGFSRLFATDEAENAGPRGG
jgi:hypothetical protein